MFTNLKTGTVLIDNPCVGVSLLAASLGATLDSEAGPNATGREVAKILKTRGKPFEDWNSLAVIASPVIRFARAAQDELTGPESDLYLTHVGIFHKDGSKRLATEDLLDRVKSILQRTADAGPIKSRTDHRSYWPQTVWVRKTTYLLAERTISVWANHHNVPSVQGLPPIDLRLARVVDLLTAEIEEVYSSDKTLMKQLVWSRPGDKPQTAYGVCLECIRKAKERLAGESE